MLSDLRSSSHIVPIHRLERSEAYPEWSLSNLRGRLVQLCSSGSDGALTAMVPLLREVQARGEFIGWVRTTASIPYPPDLVRSGVDPAALAHVRVQSAGDAMRVASHLLRSDGFGLVVLDLSDHQPPSAALQGRVVKLAQLHDAVVVCLTHADAPGTSLGSLVSLRLQATRERPSPGHFLVTLHADKDKRHGPGWTSRRLVHGTPGLY